MLKKLRLYLETSIFNCLFDDHKPAEKADTWRLWDEIKTGKYEAVVSDIAIAEIENCPPEFFVKKDLMYGELGNIAYTRIDVENDDQTKALAKRYIENGGLPPRCKIDALHLAAASLFGCDVVLSWNCKHIVKFRAMRVVDGVNAMENLSPVKLLRPDTFLN
ncbi:hypothetical protein AGMMS49959_14790 [Planctomycetales bacterium]|nr:hypothetical protein AGMMS49959_14790 [Planctomycetales bacterium]